MAVPEIKRHKSHIDLINPSHPLLPIATACLSYIEDRSSAQELCHHLSELKETPQYGESVQQAQDPSTPALSVTADVLSPQPTMCIPMETEGMY